MSQYYEWIKLSGKGYQHFEQIQRNFNCFIKISRVKKAITSQMQQSNMILDKLHY
uniref:Uncharacterized protein n=1 Tax=Rhizophora mucronata TaxID=61149 RepID=A0A2P2PSA5_RHIMU